MPDFKRYAIYYAPPEDHPLARLGAAWLGWDAITGRPAPHPALPGLPRPVARLTETPRKYGLHGTLKPPFRLAEGRDPVDLVRALDAFAAEQGAFDIPRVALGCLGDFIAVMPASCCPALTALAANTVESLDAFRAPPSAEELDRRRAAGLSDRQESLLRRWGYPYVMGEFRFHITLTGRLGPDERETVKERLRAHFAPALGTALPVRDLCLFGEDEAGRFHLVRRAPLAH